MTTPSKYWDIDRTLTYNVLFYVITGNRTGGKTYGCKKKGISNFIKKGEQFVYTRRYEKDLKDSLPTFFKDIVMNNEFPNHEFKVDGFKLYCREKTDEDKKVAWTDDDICGFGIVLSTADNKKSISYPNVTMIIYDEFMLDSQSSVQRYLKNEPRTLMNLYETVARPGSEHPRCVMFMLSNSISVNNPFFLIWNLKMPDENKPDKNGKYIWKHPYRSIIVENVKKAEMIEAKKQHEFYSIIKGTGYDEFSIENEFINDDETFVEKRSSTARFYFSFIYKDNKLGVWVSMTEGLMWVSDQVDPSFPIVYSLTLKDHRPNTLFLRSRTQATHFNKFIQAYKDGCVRFESILIKSLCYEVIKMIMNM